MAETDVVTVFLRNRSDVLLLRRSDAVDSYGGRWGAVAGHVEGDPDESARTEIREETGIDPEIETTLRRRGEPFPVDDPSLDTRWIVHPYLFDCETRRVTPNEETDDWQWVAPPEVLRLETVPALWASYDRVRPTVGSIEADRTHGATDLSIRALEVLRDDAAVCVYRDIGDRASIRETALALVSARPAMAVLANRVDRLLHRGDEPASLRRNAGSAIDRAHRVDADVVEAATAIVEGARVATLSRSGTVRGALVDGDPEAVLVAESSPGGEGVGVASDLAAAIDAPVTLTSDAAFGSRLDAWDADVLLVGADAVFAGGDVRNKVGTFAGAASGTHTDTEVVVASATDKITPDATLPTETRTAADLTDDANVAVDNPTFERTPTALFDAIVTERGMIDSADIDAIAAEMEGRRGWRS